MFGTCPSQSSLIDRCMARHSTAPYGLSTFSPTGPFNRSARAVTPKLCHLCSLAAEMSTVPRDRSRNKKAPFSPMHGAAQDRALRTKHLFTDARRGTRPRPTDEGTFLPQRERGPLTITREPVPRKRSDKTRQTCRNREFLLDFVINSDASIPQIL